MSLTAEQKQAVASWVAAGDSLSTVQKKLSEQFQVAMTYRDVRFLVDDLNLELKDAAPKVDASDVTKAAAPKSPEPAPAKKGFFDKAKEKLGLAKEEPADQDEIASDGPEPLDEDLAGLPPDGASSVRVSVDKVVLIPGAIASGTVTFSDGVTGKWIVDQQGRPGFTEVSKPGYRPTPDDAQDFMQELSMALQRQGY